MSKYNTSKRKFSKLWNRVELVRTDIISQNRKRTGVLNSILISQPITMGFNAPIDISDDFQTMAKDHTTTGNDNEWFIAWQITFDRIDVRLIDFLNTQVVYRVGNVEEGNSVDDPTFHPISQGGLTTSQGFTSELIQIIDIPNETDENIKTVIYNKAMKLREFSFLPFQDFEVKLNAKLTNPHIYY